MPLYRTEEVNYSDAPITDTLLTSLEGLLVKLVIALLELVLITLCLWVNAVCVLCITRLGLGGLLARDKLPFLTTSGRVVNLPTTAEAVSITEPQTLDDVSDASLSEVTTKDAGQVA